MPLLGIKTAVSSSRETAVRIQTTRLPLYSTRPILSSMAESPGATHVPRRLEDSLEEVWQDGRNDQRFDVTSW